MNQNIVNFTEKYIKDNRLDDHAKATLRWFALEADKNGFKNYNLPTLVKPVKVAQRESNTINRRKVGIAFIMENISSYSGGRYHNWMQAIMLNEAGKDIVVYTDRVPAFARDFALYKDLRVEIIKDFTTLDVNAELYFGSPIEGTLAALRLGALYNRPVVWTEFDPPEWMLESNVVSKEELEERHERIRAWLIENKDKLPDYRLISNTKNAMEQHQRYFGLSKDHVVFCHPPLNDRLIELLDRSPNKERKNWIVAVSRNNARKGWEDVLAAFARVQDDYELHIITNSKLGMEEAARSYGVRVQRLHFHIQVSDAEKFSIFANARCLISGSKFEGFGMWITEARAFGIPVVCYDIKTLPDIYDKDEGMFVSPIGDVTDLGNKLVDALNSKMLTPKTDHFMPNLTPKLLEICQFDHIKRAKPEVSVLYIVLNEEKFIQASIRSVMKRPEVTEVIIVEGADRKYPKASAKGLSVDKTYEKIMALAGEEGADKINYIEYGFAENKEELRQQCLNNMSGDWGLFVDGDEVWEDSNWEKLYRFICDNPNKGALYFRHLHFWKSFDRITEGGQWDVRLFRLFRNVGNELSINFHGGEPVMEDGRSVGVAFGRETDQDIFVHHYGALKNSEDIKAKLEYYASRDTHLKVRNTWDNWKEGDNDTQWTHPGADTVVKKYEGEHPVEIVQEFLK